MKEFKFSDEEFRRIDRMSVNSLPLFLIPLGVRIANCLNNANITHIIEIYQAQEELGGFSLHTNKDRGLIKYRNFGLGSLMALDQSLIHTGFPSLREAPRVLSAYIHHVRKSYISMPRVYSDDKVKVIEL